MDFKTDHCLCFESISLLLNATNLNDNIPTKFKRIDSQYSSRTFQQVADSVNCRYYNQKITCNTVSHMDLYIPSVQLSQPAFQRGNVVETEVCVLAHKLAMTCARSGMQVAFFLSSIEQKVIFLRF